MDTDPRDATGDLSYDMAHEVTGDRPQPQEQSPAPTPSPPDDTAGDYGYDEAHDFRR